MGNKTPVVSAPSGDILVIKLGALGDVIQALGPMRAIRDHHRDARITCLTTAPFRDLLARTGYCDTVWVYDRPGYLDLPGWIRLRAELKVRKFARVYDLQTSRGSNRLFRLLWPGPYPEWSGNAAGCSHPHRNPARSSLHTLERQAEQLADAGIAATPLPSVAGLADDIADLDIPRRYCLIAPGGAGHRAGKRWPAARYRDAVQKIAATGITPVIVGTHPEAALAEQITRGIDGTRNLVGRTSLAALVSLAGGSGFALGNDNGPMHVAAVAGVISVVLYSHASDPALCAQRGPAVTIIRKPSLDMLDVDEVMAALPLRSP